MSDYISREAAIEKIREAAGCAECAGSSSALCVCNVCDVYNAICLIKSLPAADAEPVVHCKGCEHAERYERIDGTAGYYCGHPQNTFVFGDRWDRVFKPVKEPDDFCSFGLRKNQSADVRNMGEGNEHE